MDFNDTFPSDDGYQKPETWGYPLHGLQSIAISPDQAHLYAASSFDSTLVVFDRDNSSGVLTINTIFRNGFISGDRIVYGLAGAYGLSVSADGNSIYVSSSKDKALAIFDRQLSTTPPLNFKFSFVDALLSGERLIEKYRDLTDDTVLTSEMGSLQDWKSSRFPVRMGGNGHPWSFQARDSLHFVLKGSYYLAIASGESASASTTGGSANVFQWKSDEKIFTFEQTLPENGAPSDFDFITLTDREKREDFSFLFVANTFASHSPAGDGLNVYRRNSSSVSWEFYETLMLEDSGDPLEARVNAVRSLRIGGQTFLACAYGHLAVPDTAPSLIYRYVDSKGFRFHQQVQTVSASDVMSAVVDDKIGLFIFSSLYGDADGIMDNSDVKVYRLDCSSPHVSDPCGDSFQFELLQTIAAVGAYGVSTFLIPGEGSFLAISNRQDAKPSFDRAYGVYDQASEVYKWNPAANMFELHQLLDSAFQTVHEDGVPLSLAESFCAPHCRKASDGKTLPVDGLRGTSAMDFFASNGEYYLAIAQSVCESSMTLLQCEAFGVQPKSAVLQWNRVSKRFSEMRGLTDEYSLSSRGHKLTDSELLNDTVSTQAFRINGGRALKIKFVQFGEDEKFLVVSSQTRGALVVRFEFERLSLNGIVDAEPDAANEFVYAVSKFDASLLMFSRTERYDMVGSAVKSCPNKRCLNFLKVLYKEGDSESSHQGDVQGLRGAQHVSMKNGQLFVGGNVPRHELLCGRYPPVGINGNRYSSVPARCHDLDLTTEVVSTGNPDLTRGEPTVFLNGSLILEVNSKQMGSALYRTVLKSKHSNEPFSSQPKVFSLIVQQPNLAPSGDALNVIVNSVTAYREVLIAENITAGAGESKQQLIFEYTYTNALLFSTAPSLFVRSDEAGQLFGFMGFAVKEFSFGQVNFTAWLLDDGGSDAETGAYNKSKPLYFSMSILGNNRPPEFEVQPEIRLVQNGEPRWVSLFVTNMNAGGAAEQNQNLSISVNQVYTIHGPWPAAGSFAALAVFSNGTLLLQAALNRFGTFVVEIVVQDDGGTEHGGRDKSQRNSSIVVEERDPQLVLVTSAGQLNISENMGYGALYHSRYTFPSVFSLVGQEFDARLRNPTFLIISIENLELFESVPEIGPDGSMVVSVKNESFSREAQITVQASHAGTSDPSLLLQSNAVVIKVVTFGVNDPPTFEVPVALEVIEASPMQQVPFATFSVGPPDEQWQEIYFSVTVASDLPLLFKITPHINLEGVLTFETFPDAHGKATLRVQAQDNGGVENGGSNIAADGPKLVQLTVYPLPRIFAVSPGVGSISGGSAITIRGIYFGSKYSRGYEAPAYGNLSVHVGQRACENVTYVSDTEVVCITPAGIGAADLTLLISENGLNRSVVAQRAFTYALLYYSGMMDAVENAGFVGIGPSSVLTGSYYSPGASLEKCSLNLSQTVNTILPSNGLLYVGGLFQIADGKEVNHVLVWNGASLVSPLGSGTDAGVNALASFQGKIVVAGDFQHVFQADNRFLKSPLLAFWDGASWSRVGDLVLTGSISVAVTNKGSLYVGGQFQSYDSAGFNGLAKYSEDGVWAPLGGGVPDGRVLAISFVDDNMIVGGRFIQVGNITAKNLALWTSRSWSAMGDFNGEVSAVASIGEHLFVGGDFTSVSGITVNRIAGYHHGKWFPLRNGLDGKVHRLVSIGTCLYIGGAFSSTMGSQPLATLANQKGKEGKAAVAYAARWCLDLTADVEPSFEELRGLTSIGPVRDLVRTETEIAPGGREDAFVCPIDRKATHCAFPLKNKT